MTQEIQFMFPQWKFIKKEQPSRSNVHVNKPLGEEKVKKLLPGETPHNPQDFDKRQLDYGTKVELEHTSDVESARAIAMDHLSENPDYYLGLQKSDDNPPLNNLGATVKKTIRHEKGKYVLYTRDGSKVLGRFDSEEQAKKREKEINYFKNKDKIDKGDGYSGDDLEKVAKAELITFPDSVEGTKCSNCKFVNGDHCNHPSMDVDLVDGAESMCCDYWDEDGTTHWGVVQKDQPRRVATIAVRHGDHMLMGKRRDNGKWTTPGGHVEPHEDMHQGALRELREETGIKVKPEHLQQLTSLSKGMDKEKKPLHVQAFHVQMDEKPKTSMLKDPDGEVERWKWVDVSDGLPDDIKANLHVPMERNILMQELGMGETDSNELHGAGDNALAGLFDMQQLVQGMDWEMANGITDPNLAKEIALDCLENDADHYKKLLAYEDSTSDVLEKDEDGPEGFKLDLGSGNFREPGHLGIDTYPHDHGTIVHDLTQGIPFPDKTASHVRITNALHEVGDNPKPLLSEIQRVLMPGGQFIYEGPNELLNAPEWLVQTDFTSNEENVQKIEGQPAFRQTFTRLASPDEATANDSEPRIGIAQYDMLPADALLAMDALGYYWSDATSSGRGNRLHGYPSQGALVKNDDTKPHPLMDWLDSSPIGKYFTKMLKKKPVDNTTATPDQDEDDGDDIAMAKSALTEEMKPGLKKSNDKNVEKSLKDQKYVPIFKADNEKQLVYGVVLSPDEVDSQEDWMHPDDIEKAAHYYIKNSRVVGSGHSKVMDGAEVVESYIAPQDIETSDGQYGPQKIKKGSWVLGVKINDKKEWAKVKDGEYTGFSVGGFGLREPSTSATV